MGRFDADGFLTLLDRKKDMIISGGFNVYPSDLESGCANTRTSATSRWSACLPTPGETPVGFVVAREGAGASEAELLSWINARLGKTQRLAALHYVESLPRSAIGKVLKRELRDGYGKRL